MTGIIAHLLWYSLRWEIWFSRAEFQAFYGEGIIQHAQKKAEGRQLSEPSTWECSQVHWDDGLMQSLSSMSFEADPLPTLPHTWITLLISLPLCLILLPCSALVSHLLFPHAFFFFTFQPLSPLFSVSPLTPAFALYCSFQEMREAFNYCVHGIINGRPGVCSAGHR